MTPDRWQRIEEVFHAALERSTEDRSQYLDCACADDAALRDSVERLLRGNAETDDFLAPPDDPMASPVALELPAGQSIGPFKLVRTIAIGGSASVFEALQQHPRRRVALKLPRLESTSAAAQRRFERECDILASLRHPGIAQVYQAGVANGRFGKLPYFAMEFVDGARNLVEYSNAEGLTQPDRISLFAQVCDAVEHGHGHGIVHRDLKPGNILVDCDGRPKVIDFGVAYVTGFAFRVTTTQTDYGQLLGTLSYMSPEQWRGDTPAIAPATDVYALGVVLYELVTNELPHNLHGLSLVDAAHIVETRAAARPTVVPDLEAVILTALDKDPARRYASAGELAEDLRRFLDHRPVHARPPGWLRQLALLVRRNRAAAAVVLLTLLTTVFATLLVLNGSLASKTEAALREQATRVVTLLQDVLRSARPDRRAVDQAQIDMLTAVAAQIESDFARFPDTEARLRMTLGDTYVALGLYDKSEHHLRRSHTLRLELPTQEPRELARAKCALGNTLVKTAQNHEAEALLRDASELAQSAGDDDTLARSLGSLAECRMEQGALAEAEQHYRASADLTHKLLGEHHERTRDMLNGLAASLLRQTKLDEAEALLRKLIDQHDGRGDREDLVLADSLSRLGTLLVERQRYRDAQAALRRALSIMRRLQDPDHPSIGGTLNALGVAHMQLDEHDVSEHLLVESLAIRRRRLGNDHPDLADTLNNLGFVRKERGDYTLAETSYREALRIQEASINSSKSLDSMQERAIPK